MFKKTVFAIVLVLGLLLVVAVAVAAAAGPYIDTGSGVDTYTETWCAGFDIEHTIRYAYTDKYFFDDWGNLVKIKSHVNGQDILVNAVTGKTLKGYFANNVDYFFEGDTVLYHSSGQDWNITYPGMGQIFKQEGTVFVEFPPNGPPIIHHMSGSHTDGFFGNFTELCAALGQ